MASDNTNKATQFDIAKQAMAVLDSLGEPVRVVGPGLKTLATNSAFRGLYGDISDKLCFREVRGLDTPCPECPVTAVLRTGLRASAVACSRSNDESRWVELVATPLRDASGILIAAVETVHDVTSRQKVEEELRRRNKQLEAFTAIAQAFGSKPDLDEVVRVALDKVVEALGANSGTVRFVSESGEILRLFAHKGLSEAYVSQFSEALVGEGMPGRAARSGQVALVDDTTLEPDTLMLYQREGLRSGAAIPLRSRSKLLGVLSIFSREIGRFDGRDVDILAAIGSEIGVAIEEARLFGELEEKTKEGRIRALQLQSVLARDYGAQEQERKRISRDIHDGIGQLVSGAMMQVHAASSAAGKDGKGGRGGDLSVAEKLLRQAIDEMQTTMFNLSPPIVDLGLVPAMQKYLTLCEASLELSCHLQSSGAVARLAPEAETAVYRIVQEAIQNVHKHAQATDAYVFLEFAPARLKVTVQDNGQGFSQEAREDDDWHLGMISLQERVLGIGGKLDIQSWPGLGTRLVIELPTASP